MSYEFHTADVFTDKLFGGNQLAVLPDARSLTGEQMAAIAREFNYSETVFVFPPEDPTNTRKVRIFTPGGELPFAGHPTVGAAFVLAVTGEIALDGDETRIVLEEGVGPVPVVIRLVGGVPQFCQLTAAKVPEVISRSYNSSEIAAVLSLDAGELDTEGDYAIEAVSVGLPFLFVPLRSQDALSRSRLNLPKWEEVLASSSARDVFLFTEDDSSRARGGMRKGDAIVRARMFGPGVNVAEDPATGSACAALGGYLAWRSEKRDGTIRYTVHQGVEMGRPSLIEVETDVSGGVVTAVRVGGTSVLVSSGTLHHP